MHSFLDKFITEKYSILLTRQKTPHISKSTHVESYQFRKIMLSLLHERYSILFHDLLVNKFVISSQKRKFTNKN